MKFSIIFTLFSFILCCFASDIVVLTPDNFDSYVDNSRPAFIEFFAPWCGHCKKLAPEYEIVATAFKSKSSSVLVASVDCDEHKALCSDYGVSGYPTLKWFSTTDEPEPYSGGRTAEDIIKFINQKTGLKAKVPGKAPSAVVELTDSNFNDLITNSNKPAFVKFFAPWCGHCKNLEPTYEKFASAFVNEDDVVIARIDCDANKDTCNKFSVTGYPTLKWFSANDRSSPDAYDGERSLDALVDFVNDKAGTKRTSSGLLDESAGLLEEFNDLVTKFKNNKSSVSMDEVNNIVESVGTKMAKVYKRAFEKGSSDESYFTNEVERLQRMIDSGSVQGLKIDEFTQRINILNQFQ